MRTGWGDNGSLLYTGVYFRVFYSDRPSLQLGRLCKSFTLYIHGAVSPHRPMLSRFSRLVENDHSHVKRYWGFGTVMQKEPCKLLIHLYFDNRPMSEKWGDTADFENVSY